jgi:hypothetical protein
MSLGECCGPDQRGKQGVSTHRDTTHMRTPYTLGLQITVTKRPINALIKTALILVTTL